MKNNKSVCPYNNEIECNRVNSCKYLFHRFGVLECEGEQYKKTLINVMHQKELKEREELMKNNNYHTGENYKKGLDLTYKDIIINPESDRKKEC